MQDKQKYSNTDTKHLKAFKFIFPRYNMKCRGKRDTRWNNPHSIKFSPLHFMLYRGKSITFVTVHAQKSKYCKVDKPFFNAISIDAWLNTCCWSSQTAFIIQIKIITKLKGQSNEIFYIFFHFSPSVRLAGQCGNFRHHFQPSGKSGKKMQPFLHLHHFLNGCLYKIYA